MLSYYIVNYVVKSSDALVCHWTVPPDPGRRGCFVLQAQTMTAEPQASLPSPKADREGRRDALLEAAAAEFNARGISRASISRIAAAKGLTRAAVYYYVRDRDDLVFQAYRR